MLTRTVLDLVFLTCEQLISLMNLIAPVFEVLTTELMFQRLAPLNMQASTVLAGRIKSLCP